MTPSYYLVGYRQPGFDPETEPAAVPTFAEACARNAANAREALAGLPGWTLNGPDEDGDYFLTAPHDTFAWHYYVEPVEDPGYAGHFHGDEPCNDAREHLAAARREVVA